MAEIKNYTLKFGFGRPAGLTCCRKLAYAEVKRLIAQLEARH